MLQNKTAELLKNILETEDKEYMKRCVGNEFLGLSSVDKARIIIATGDFEYAEQCLIDTNLEWSPYGRVKLIQGINEWFGGIDYIKRCLTDTKINLKPREKKELIVRNKKCWIYKRVSKRFGIGVDGI